MNERPSVLDARGECKRISLCRSSSMLFLPFVLLLLLPHTQTHISFVRSLILSAHLSSRFSWQTVWRIGCCIGDGAVVVVVGVSLPSSYFPFDFSF